MSGLFTRDELKREFPLTEKFLYFAGASTGILPERTIAAQIAFLNRYRQTDMAHDPETFFMMAELRANIARLLNCEKGEIALVPNTSVGINAIAAAYPWENGDEILIGSREFPANSYPWLNAHHMGAKVIWIPMQTGRITPNMIEKHISPKTKMITISEVQFSDGYRSDVRQVVEMAKNQGIYVFVDGIQAMGVLKVDARHEGFHAFASGGQKHMLSPYGTGFLYVKRGFLECLNPAYDGWLSHFIEPEDFTDLLRHDMPSAPDAKRFEVGSHAYQALWGMSESVKMFLELGIENIEAHCLGLSDYLCDRVSGIKGVSVLSDRDGAHRTHIVSLKVPNATAVRDELTKRKVVVSLREGALRFAFHVYNTKEQIEIALGYLNNILVKTGVNQ